MKSKTFQKYTNGLEWENGSIMLDLDNRRHIARPLTSETAPLTESKISYTTKTVYVSGPYTQGDQMENVGKAIDAAEKLSRAGYAPVIPHLSALWQMKYPHDWGFWIDIDLAILAMCDFIYRIPGESEGADIEMEFAKKNGIYELVEDHGRYRIRAIGDE
ncbi:MAG: DUF4406 domain-containing protein [Methanoregula sp.]|nr:DUF4406 domain-containing protein [Methanoregula sp.]